MEKMNQDIPFEHQMMFIIRDYDRKVEENMELRKEVEELSAALEKQGVQLRDAKVDLKNEIKKEEEAEKALKKKPTFDEKVLQKQMTDLKKKNKILSKQVNQLHRTLQYVRNRTWTLLEENFIPELEKLELQMRKLWRNMKKWLGIFIRNEYLCSQVNAGVHRTYSMFVCTFVSRQTLRIEVENVLHLFYISFLVWSHPCVKNRCFCSQMLKFS